MTNHTRKAADLAERAIEAREALKQAQFDLEQAQHRHWTARDAYQIAVSDLERFVKEDPS